MAEITVRSAFVNRTIGNPTFVLGVSEGHSKKDENGQWVTTGYTNFDLKAWRDSGIDLSQFSVGDRIEFTGRQRTEKYEHNGVQREKLVVNLDSIKILSKGNQQGSGQSQSQGGWGAPAGQVPQSTSQPAADTSSWNVPGDAPSAPSSGGFGGDDIDAPF